MYCKYCGEETQDDAIFCSKCGKSLKKNANSESIGKNITTENIHELDNGFIDGETVCGEAEEIIQETKNKKDDYKIVKTILGALVALIIAILCLLYIEIKSDGFDLDGYVVFADQGYNGEGESKASIDNNRLMSDLSESKQINRMFLEKTFISDAAPSVNIISNSENLSNGDVVVAEITYGRGFDKKLGVRFKTKKVEHVVEGLEEKPEIIEEIEDVEEQENAHEHLYAYEKETDTTHKKKCTEKGCSESITEICTYDESGECLCGNLNPTAKLKKEFYDQYGGIWFEPEDEYYLWIKDSENGAFGVTSEGFSYERKFDIESVVKTSEGVNLNILLIGENDEKTEYREVMHIKNTEDENIIDNGDGYKLYLMRMSEANTPNDLLNNFGGVADAFVSEVKKIDKYYYNPAPIGKWFTEGYDEIENWAGSYIIKLDEKGNALCTGYRNNDIGKYEKIDDYTYKLTFKYGLYDEAGEGWTMSDECSYTVDLQVDSEDTDSAYIHVEDPMVVTNLTDTRICRVEEEDE